MGLKRDSIVSLIGTAATGAVMLVSIPLLLHKIGDARFGALTLVWLLAGYAGLLDFGLSRATARDIARAQEVDQYARILWSAVWVSALVGSSLGLGVYLFGARLLTIFTNSSMVENNLGPIIPWIAGLIPLGLINGVFVGALEGRQKFVAVNIGQVLTAIFMQALPTIAAYGIGPELIWVVPAAVLARLLSVILFCGIIFGHVIPGRPRFIDREITRGLFATGTWFSFASVLGSLFSTIDKFLIASLIGPSAVAHYSVPESVVRRASLVPMAMVRPLFPRLASLEEAPSRLLAQRSLELVIVIITPIVVVAILGITIFLKLWVGEEFSRISAPVGALIALGVWFNSVAFIPDAFLQGRGRASVSALCSMIELPPHLLLLYVGLTRFGLIGGAFALLLTTLLDLILLMAFARLELLKLQIFWVGCGFVVAAYVTSQMVFGSPVGIGVSIVEIFGVTIWSCLMSKDLQMMLRSMRDLTRSVLTKVHDS